MFDEGAVGDLSRGDGSASRCSCLCEFQSLVTASFMALGRGVVLLLVVERDLEAVPDIPFPLTPKARLEERLGLKAFRGRDDASRACKVFCGVRKCRIGEVSLDVVGEACERGDFAPVDAGVGLKAGIGEEGVVLEVLFELLDLVCS